MFGYSRYIYRALQLVSLCCVRTEHYSRYLYGKWVDKFTEGSAIIYTINRHKKNADSYIFSLYAKYIGIFTELYMCRLYVT